MCGETGDRAARLRREAYYRQIEEQKAQVKAEAAEKGLRTAVKKALKFQGVNPQILAEKVNTAKENAILGGLSLARVNEIVREVAGTDSFPSDRAA